MKTKHRRNVILSLVIVLVVCFIGIIWRLFWPPSIFISEPSTTQNFFRGTITDVFKVDKVVDGKRILYSVRLDIEGVGGSITKDTTIYEIIHIEHEKETFISTRKEATIDDLRVGQKVEVWSRLANNHLYEAYEITIMADSD